MILSSSELYDMIEQTKLSIGQSGSFIVGHELVREVKLPEKDNFINAGFPILITMYDDSVFKITKDMEFDYFHSFEYNYKDSVGFCRLSVKDNNGNEVLKIGSVSPQPMAMDIVYSYEKDDTGEYCVPITAEINGHEITIDAFHYIFSATTVSGKSNGIMIDDFYDLFVEGEDSYGASTIAEEAFYWTVDTFKNRKAEEWLEKSKERTYSDEGVSISIDIDLLYNTLSKHLSDYPDKYNQESVICLYKSMIEEYGGPDGHESDLLGNDIEIESIQKIICSLHNYSFEKLPNEEKPEMVERFFSVLVNIEYECIEDYYKVFSTEMSDEFLCGALHNALDMSNVCGDDFKSTWKEWILKQKGIMSDDNSASCIATSMRM